MAKNLGESFAVFKKGTVEYMNENYESVELTVDSNTIYVITKENEAVQIKKYFGKELRNLIAEGI